MVKPFLAKSNVILFVLFIVFSLLCAGFAKKDVQQYEKSANNFLIHHQDDVKTVIELDGASAKSLTTIFQNAKVVPSIPMYFSYAPEFVQIDLVKNDKTVDSLRIIRVSKDEVYFTSTKHVGPYYRLLDDNLVSFFKLIHKK